MEKAPIKIVMLLVLALGAVAGARWLRDDRRAIQAPAPGRQLEAASLREQDLGSLRKDAGAEAVRGGLIRLGESGDPAALEGALARMRDPDARVREGAAAALGNFEDARSLAALAELGRDAALPVRIASLESLARKAGPARLAALKAALARSKEPSERAAAAGGIARHAAGAERAGALAELRRLAKDAPASGAARRAILSAPDAPETLAIARDALQAAVPAPGLVSQAISALASARDPWLAANLDRLRDHSSPEVRLGVLETLHFTCPVWAESHVAGTLERERDERLFAAALSGAKQLGGESMKQALARLRDNAGFSETERAAIREAHASITAPGSRCPGTR